MTKPPAALLERAIGARSNAYNPYSKFAVGAAVLTNSGQIFSGCNIENASYGLTICAERVAIFHAVSAGASKIVELAVSCQPTHLTANGEGMMPCGACLQVMAEFGSPDLIIHVDNVGTYKLKELLPHAFFLSQLSK